MRLAALVLLAVLSLAVAAACGGGESTDTETSGAAGTQTETQAQAGSDDEIEARGTVQAFVVAASRDDVETFCGLVTQTYRDQIEPGLTEEACVPKLNEIGAPSLKRFDGGQTQGVTVSGETAEGEVRLRDNELWAVLMRKENDRWLIERFDKR